LADAKPAKSAPRANTLRIQYMPLSEIAKWPRNPKEHDLGELGKSFARFGFINPLILDEDTQRLVAGHGRLAELEALKASGANVPLRLREKNGEWYVPVVRGVHFGSERDANAYLLADNQLTIRGGWKEDELAACLKALEQLDGTGFSQKDLAKLLKGLEPLQTSANIQEIPSQFLVLIECESEVSQVALLERFIEEGLKCRALSS